MYGESICILAWLHLAVTLQHGVDLPTTKPLNIAHQGASGILPEHTMEAYQAAINQGADVIECDVVVTKDRVPLCLHESWLNRSTDIASRPEFAGKVNTYTINGTPRTDWFTVDLTLSEVKQIRKVQSNPLRDQSKNGLYHITTMDEYLTLARNAGRKVGVYPEVKDPSWVNSLPQFNDQRIEDVVVERLHNHGYRESTDPAFIQCFEEASLRYMADKTNLPLVFLTNSQPTAEQLQRWKGLFYGIGPWKDTIVKVWQPDSEFKNYIRGTTSLVSDAHAAGLRVHVWTMRNEDKYLAWDFHQDAARELQFYLDQGVDGVFTDFPGTLTRHLAARNCSGDVSAGRGQWDWCGQVLAALVLLSSGIVVMRGV